MLSGAGRSTIAPLRLSLRRHRPISSVSGSRLEILKSTLANENELDSKITVLSSSDSVSSRLKRKTLKKPKWLKIEPTKARHQKNYEKVRDSVHKLGLATVCEEAKCPNITECWGGGDDRLATATIMIMGEACTRACRFCSVKTLKNPPPLDPMEPDNVATAIASWGLGYVVLTSVDRDDLKDQGAEHFAETVKRLKQKNPKILVECLTPDFQGDVDLVDLVASSGLDVFAHNVETTEARTPHVRDRRAGYRQSLAVLKRAKQQNPLVLTKTSLMLGCGETIDQVRQTMRDLIDNDVDVVTFGQYLRPSKRHMRVHEYVEPEVFELLEKEAREMGFLFVASGPLVRSSYKAGELFLKHHIEKTRSVGV